METGFIISKKILGVNMHYFFYYIKIFYTTLSVKLTKYYMNITKFKVYSYTICKKNDCKILAKTTFRSKRKGEGNFIPSPFL